MAILSSEIKYRLSGGSSNSSQNASLGGVESTTTDASSSLFDAVASGEASAGSVEYRCVYVKNTNGTLTLQGARVFIQANTPSPGTDLEIGLGTSAIGGTEQTVANETTAPTGVTFSNSAVDFASGLVIGDLAPGQSKAVWIRRTVTAGAGAYSDSGNLRVQGDTNP